MSPKNKVSRLAYLERSRKNQDNSSSSNGYISNASKHMLGSIQKEIIHEALDESAFEDSRDSGARDSQGSDNSVQHSKTLFESQHNTFDEQNRISKQITHKLIKSDR